MRERRVARVGHRDPELRGVEIGSRRLRGLLDLGDGDPSHARRDRLPSSSARRVGHGEVVVERDARLDDRQEQGDENGRDECELDGGLPVLFMQTDAASVRHAKTVMVGRLGAGPPSEVCATARS